jgi:uncharacterized protein involved in exopolysaccharide biosynthesis
MNKAHIPSVESEHHLDHEGTDLIEILTVLAKHKKLLIKLPLAAAILSAAISVALPDVYRATATLLPPQQSQSSAAALLSQLGSFAGAASSAAGIKNPNDLYVGMLKSRTVADRLIARFNLQKVYDTDLVEKARKKLEDKTSIVSGKDGLITIDVEDSDPKRVTQLTNAYVDELLRLTKILAVTEASQRRIFYEQQLEQAKNNLANAEVAMKHAIDTSGVISVDSDSRALVETIGRLRAQIAAKEIQIRSTQAFITTANPEYQRAEEELNSLKAQLAKLENGHASDATNEQPSNDKAGFESIKVLRDVKYYQMLYELLAKQYELARLDEAKDPSVIQVLDQAVVPERKVKPQRAIIVVLGTVLGLLAAVSISFFGEMRQRALRVPGTAERVKALRENLKFK